jgi:homogentisate 1,2-dioxygenase
MSFVVVQIPNEKLMAEDILNITQSKVYQDRIYFDVDASRVTQDKIDDLSKRVQKLVMSDSDGHFFDQGFESFAHVHKINDPLKYEVRCLEISMLAIALMQRGMTMHKFAMALFSFLVSLIKVPQP